MDQKTVANQQVVVEEPTASSARLRVRLNEANMATTYCNAFRANTSAEELFIDMGVNVLSPTPAAAADASNPDRVVGEIRFELTNRIIMNYYTAKRLTALLAQLVKRYEDRHGELKMNASDRAVPR